MTPCTHGMPTPGSCIDCMDEGNLAPRKPDPKPTVEYVFEAQYPGSCGGCDLPIDEGERIARMTDETYQHAACAYGKPSPAMTSRNVC